jgi:hypothetical protein
MMILPEISLVFLVLQLPSSIYNLLDGHSVTPNSHTYKKKKKKKTFFLDDTLFLFTPSIYSQPGWESPLVLL